VAAAVARWEVTDRRRGGVRVWEFSFRAHNKLLALRLIARLLGHLPARPTAPCGWRGACGGRDLSAGPRCGLMRSME
jgi:hypothetical protein